MLVFINPWRACTLRVTVVVLCVCVSVCVSVFCVLPSCAFRRPTRGISGYSAENAAKNKKTFSLKLLSLKVRSDMNLPRLRQVSHFLHVQCFRISLCNTYVTVIRDHITWNTRYCIEIRLFVTVFCKRFRKVCPQCKTID